MKKSPNKAEKAHLTRIAEMGCLVCGGPAEIHHLLSKRPRNHRWAVPLCPNHHRTSRDGLHWLGNEKKWFKHHKIDAEAWAEREWEISNGIC